MNSIPAKIIADTKEDKSSSDFPDPMTTKKAHQRFISDELFYRDYCH